MQRKFDFGKPKETPFRWKIGPTLTKSDFFAKMGKFDEVDIIPFNGVISE